MSKKLKGSCHCGAFQFDVAEPLGEVRLCHCDDCRRANGTAFSANCRVPVEQFTVLTDRSTVTEYQSSENAWRAFCSKCGSPVYARAEWDPEGIRLRLGTLEARARPKITSHVWVGSKADWDVIRDDLPKHVRGADGPLLDES